MYRKDATLREVVTTLRNTCPTTAEYRHPLARFTFRTVYADALNKGRFAQKDLGQVYSRDIIGDPGSLDSVAPRLLRDDDDDEIQKERGSDREERTLDELRFVPGDYLLIAVLFPKSVNFPSEIGIKGAANSNGWTRGSTGRDSGWATAAPPVNLGRGGGHWRGDSHAPVRGGRGGGGRGRGIDRDRDIRDRRPPPPRRPRRSRSRSPKSRSRSRSRSPPTKGRKDRYD